jgi:hypothetical protein
VIANAISVAVRRASLIFAMSVARRRSASTISARSRATGKASRPAEAVSELTQLSHTREAADRRLDLGASHPLEHGHATAHRSLQQRCETIALLAGGGVGEYREAARRRARTR